MLQSLHVKNLALIDEIEVEFAAFTFSCTFAVISLILYP